MKTAEVTEALGALAHEHRLKIFRLLVERGLAASPAASEPLELEVRFCVRGALSPLLSNIFLNDLDHELERRQLPRGRLEIARQRREKCGGEALGTQVLGFSVTAHREGRLRIAPASVQRLMQKVGELMRAAATVMVLGGTRNGAMRWRLISP